MWNQVFSGLAWELPWEDLTFWSKNGRETSGGWNFFLFFPPLVPGPFWVFPSGNRAGDSFTWSNPDSLERRKVRGWSHPTVLLGDLEGSSVRHLGGDPADRGIGCDGRSELLGLPIKTLVFPVEFGIWWYILNFPLEPLLTPWEWMIGVSQDFVLSFGSGSGIRGPTCFTTYVTLGKSLNILGPQFPGL